MIASSLAVTALLALSNVASVKAVDMDPFTVDIAVTFDDPDAAKLTDSDQKIVSDCIVSSFNDVHDTSIIKLDSYDIKKWQPNASASFLSKLLPGALTSSGGSYTWGQGSGGNCRACGNDDMLGATDLAYSHSLWQAKCTECLDSSGSDALAKAANVVIKVGGETDSVAVVRDPSKEDFTVDIAVTFDDPDASSIDDSDKEIISDCIVSSFNDVHDTSMIELYSFDMKKFDPSPSGSYLSKILPGAVTSSGGSYTWGQGSGGNCRACGNDDMLGGASELAYSHTKWQTACQTCLDNSGSTSLAKASNVLIKVGGESASVAARDPSKEEFTFDIELTFDDSHAGDLTDEDKPTIEKCLCDGFNEVHDTSIIELYSFDIKKFENTQGSLMSLLRGSPAPLSATGGSYTWGQGSGGNCRACGNDDMLGASILTETHTKWQHATKKCLQAEGSDALAHATNLLIKIDEPSEATNMMM